MTDATGQSFLSYRRFRKEDAALVIAAQHDHGIPTWQDTRNLGTVPTEDELRRVLAAPTTASAVLLITPEVEDSPIIRNVEVPLIVQRTEADDGFFVVPVAGGGLDYARAADVTSNCLSAQNLSDWNVHRIPADHLSSADAAQVAARILSHRLQAVHRQLPPAAPLHIGLFVRRPPPFEAGVALAIDWNGRFTEKEAAAETWRDLLLPALSRISDAVRQHAPGRAIEAFGLPTLPAACALGSAFMATGGLSLRWRQLGPPGQPNQHWDLSVPRERSGFRHRIFSKSPAGRDVAVLVSVADNTEPVFATTQNTLPPLRAMVHVTKSAEYPHLLKSPAEAADVALIVQEGLRQVRRQYGNIGTVHLFMAVPAGLAVLIGQLLNTFGDVQTYEHVGIGGSGRYMPAALLKPCA
jgi:hypothetical protein